MTEKDEDIQIQHEWRNGWRGWRGWRGEVARSKRERVRQKEADEVFKEFREWYDDWFRVRKVQYNRVSSGEC